MSKDPYTVLGVSTSATPDEIKKAFHKLAHVHHPDKGGNADTFKEISAAYAALKDRAPAAPRQSQPYTPPRRSTHTSPDGRTTYTFYGTQADAFNKAMQDHLEALRRQQMEEYAAQQRRRAMFYGSNGAA